MGDPYIGDYISNKIFQYPNPKAAKQSMQHAIVPLASWHTCSLDYITRSVVNLSGAKSTVIAFFEVKTFTACKSLCNFNNTTTNSVSSRSQG